MDTLINLTFRFDEDTFNKAVDIYENDLTQTAAVEACMAAALDHTGEDVKKLAMRLDRADRAKLERGFMDAYCRCIIDHLGEEE